jgi:hypothetical protein
VRYAALLSPSCQCHSSCTSATRVTDPLPYFHTLPPLPSPLLVLLIPSAALHTLGFGHSLLNPPPLFTADPAYASSDPPVLFFVAINPSPPSQPATLSRDNQHQLRHQLATSRHATPAMLWCWPLPIPSEVCDWTSATTHVSVPSSPSSILHRTLLV